MNLGYCVKRNVLIYTDGLELLRYGSEICYRRLREGHKKSIKSFGAYSRTFILKYQKMGGLK
jgi:hypothetical protein